ncbi:hypothetical protein ACLOJK_040397 [Asimina triloba]
MSNALEVEEKHRLEVLKNLDEERRPLSGKKAPYFFRVTKESSQSKKKVLVAFIPSKKRSLMAFIEEIIRENFKALRYPFSSKLFNSSNPNEINTRDAPVLPSDEGRVHEIFNMMGCKKERVVKDASSDASSESRMVCTFVRLFPTLCISVLCLTLLPYTKNPATSMKILLSAILRLVVTSGSRNVRDYYGNPKLTMDAMGQKAGNPSFFFSTVGVYECQNGAINKSPKVIHNYLFQLHFRIKKREEAPEEEKAGESSNAASLRTDKNQGNLPASISVKSDSARTSSHQDNEVSFELKQDVSNSEKYNSNEESSNFPSESSNFPSEPVDSRLDATLFAEFDKHSSTRKSSSDVHFLEKYARGTLNGHGSPFRQSSKSISTSQRNCSRFCMLFVLITTLMIITAICYMSRRNFIISTSKLEPTASKETQEFVLHRSGSRVLLPTRNDIQTEGKEKELGTTGCTEHAGSLRESMVINSSSTTDVKLRIAVPIKKGFHEFIKIYSHPKDNHTFVTGFVADVFNEVMKTLSSQVSWEFIPYQASHEDATGYYDKLAHQINLKVKLFLVHCKC